MLDAFTDDELAMETVECGNPSCNCRVSGTDEPYCNEVCKSSTTDVCECGHPECGGPLR